MVADRADVLTRAGVRKDLTAERETLRRRVLRRDDQLGRHARGSQPSARALDDVDDLLRAPAGELLIPPNRLVEHLVIARYLARNVPPLEHRAHGVRGAFVEVSVVVCGPEWL